MFVVRAFVVFEKVKDFVIHVRRQTYIRYLTHHGEGGIATRRPPICVFNYASLLKLADNGEGTV